MVLELLLACREEAPPPDPWTLVRMDVLIRSDGPEEALSGAGWVSVAARVGPDCEGTLQTSVSGPVHGDLPVFSATLGVPVALAPPFSLAVDVGAFAGTRADSGQIALTEWDLDGRVRYEFDGDLCDADCTATHLDLDLQWDIDELEPYRCQAGVSPDAQGRCTVGGSLWAATCEGGSLAVVP